MLPRILLSLAAACAALSAQEVRPVGRGPLPGSAAAVVVSGRALAHTAQFLAMDRVGAIAAKGDATAQAERVLARLDATLGLVGGRLEQVVKLNACVANPEAADKLGAVLARRFRGRLPALSLVAGALPHPDALVAIDAVAALDNGPAAGTRKAGVAVLPAGPRVYISGQAVQAKSVPESALATMQSLKRTLDFLGLSLSDVVQVKSFLHPMAAASEVEKRIAAFFGEAAPPQVFVEWTTPDRIEIEMIAAAKPRPTGAPVEYLTPPEFTPSPLYAKVVRAAHPATIYISGLYPAPGRDAASQIKDLFAQLTGILGRTGGDLRHLVKATYYVATDDTSRLLNELRPDYYDPKRPPAASKAPVAGTGLSGREISMDMIAVPAR